MTLSIVMPSMRPHKALAVVYDMLHQTLVPNNILIVDNSCRIDFDKLPIHSECSIKVLCFGKNIGTNPVWNMVYNFSTEFVGMVADDLRLDLDLFRKMLLMFRDKRIGAVCPAVVNTLPLPKLNPKSFAARTLPASKGQAGVLIIKRELLDKVPKIPKQFRVFYGDTWLGFWIRKKLRKRWVQLRSNFIYHKPGPNQVSESLNYQSILRSEREKWKELAL